MVFRANTAEHRATPNPKTLVTCGKLCYTGSAKISSPLRWAAKQTGEPLKPAADAQDTAQTIQTTTIRKVVPAFEEQKTPDLWEYLRSIRLEDWPKHFVYGYRTEPGPKIQIFRCSEQFLTLPSGRRTPISDEQEMEFALTQEFGGGVYRLLVKRGAQIITAGNIEIGAPARAIRIPVDPQQSGNGPNGASTPTYASDATMIANKAIDTVAGAEHQAVRIGIDALGAAANIVRTFGSSGQPTNDQTMMLAEVLRELREQRRGMGLSEILAAATSVIGILKELGILGQNSNPLIGQIMETGLKRLLDPPATGAPVSATAEIARAVPGALSNFVEIMREQRILSENQVRALELQRGTPAPRIAVPVSVPQPNPQLIPPPTSPANGATNMQQLEFAESKVIEILQKYWHREPFDAEQAADDVIAFLEPFDAKIVPTLAAMEESGLVQYFQRRPILQQAAKDPAKLQLFIRAFLKMHAEDVGGPGAPQGEQAKPVLPN